MWRQSTVHTHTHRNSLVSVKDRNYQHSAQSCCDVSFTLQCGQHTQTNHHAFVQPLSKTTTHLFGQLVHIKHVRSSHYFHLGTAPILSMPPTNSRTRLSLLSGALCINPEPQTLITAGMCMMKGDCAPAARRGSFSLCALVFLSCYRFSASSSNTHTRANTLIGS